MEISDARKLMDRLSLAPLDDEENIADEHVAKFFQDYLKDRGIPVDELPDLDGNACVRTNGDFCLMMKDGSQFLFDPHHLTTRTMPKPEWVRTVIERRQEWVERALAQVKPVYGAYADFDYSVGVCFCYTGIAIDIWRKSKGLEYQVVDLVPIYNHDRKIYTKKPAIRVKRPTTDGVIVATLNHFGLHEQVWWGLITANDKGASTEHLNDAMLCQPIVEPRQ